MASDAEVIDWDEAMQQCGDDEEFLRELLDDLRSETDTQVEKMEDVLKAPDDSCFVQIMRAAHVIKGAASNLMCGDLRKCAAELETTANVASKEKKDYKDEAIMKSLKEKFEALQKAVKNFHDYLEKVGV